ncbi:MAG: hypothetical protein K5979_09495 [Ruminococcus sp.]|nr:hypothetical protein [Ruminococcus sp.]
MKDRSNWLTAAAVSVFVIATGTFMLGKMTMNIKSADIRRDASGGIGKALQSYSAECIAGRKGWISAGSMISDAIRGNTVNGVYVSDNRLIDADISKRGSSAGCAGSINGFADWYDGAVYIAAVPTSSGVYGDTVPSYIMKTTEKQQIDNFYGQLDTGIRRIDAYNILKMMSDEHIYFSSDTKWTMYGAYCVYRTVIQKLGFQPVSYDKYNIRHVTGEYRGDLYSRTLYMKCEPDILDIYEYPEGTKVTSCVSYSNDGKVSVCSLYDTDALGSEDMYDLYLGGEKPLVRIRTDVNNDRRLLVIGSRCAASFVPFLTQHYSEIAVISPEAMNKPITSLLEPNDYEQTLFLIGIDSVESENFKFIEMRELS